jgi:uncharacterized membrane protein YbhN (UPF0104 family)
VRFWSKQHRASLTRARLARILFGAAGIAFLAIAFRQTLHKSEGLSLPGGRHLAAAGGLQLAAIVFAAMGWATLFDGRNRWLLARGYFAAQLAKYIPGAIWQPIGQIRLAADAGVPLGPATFTFLVHSIVQTVAGASLATLLVFSDGPSTSVRLLALLGLVLLPVLRRSWALSIMRAVGRWTRRRSHDDLVPGQPALLRSYGWAAATLVSGGVIFAVLLSSVLPSSTHVSPVLIIPAFILAWTAGYVAIPFPSGLGVREGVLIAILSPLVPAAPIIAASVFQRLVAMGAELTVFAMSWVKRGAPGPWKERRSRMEAGPTEDESSN